MKDALTRAALAVRQGRPGEAAGICQDLLRSPGLREPVRTEARKIRDEAIARLGGAGHALALLEWATGVGPRNPVWLALLSDLYRMVGRVDEAIAISAEVARLEPGDTLPRIALARLHADRGDTAAAIRSILDAIAIEPESAVAHFGLAQLLLLRGEYIAGWSEYEWRHKLPGALARQPRIRLPTWNGMCLPHDHLLLHSDQGFGDTFQFARYIPQVVARVGRVTLHCEPACLPVLELIPGLHRATDDWSAIEAADAHSTLASLPRLFGTQVETVPSSVPYLSARPACVESWAKILEERLPAGVTRVGLAWAGNPAQSNDRRRTVPLAALADLLTIPGAAFVSLQKEKRNGDEAASRSLTNLLDLGPDLADFSDTAAVIANLDVTISICSSVTHLAGALGRPVWVMLSEPADWRWLTARDDSPWYPTARLFRQSSPGDWGPVIRSLRAALATLVSARQSS